MGELTSFGVLVAATSLVVLIAVLSNRLTERLRIPAPVLFLVGAAIASDLVPALGDRPILWVQHVVTIALALILFDGGLNIGWHRFRENAGAIVWLGVAGTLVTAAALAGIAHWLFGFDWRLGLLLATALAPTDPAVVFSVLGRRRLSGRAGVLLEGESGANDPVGIALLVALIAAGSSGGPGAVRDGLLVFVLQMVVGSIVGLAGGQFLLWSMRRVSLPSEGLYPVRVLAGAGLLFGVATLAQGSGFLAVFIAGIVLGDARAPYKLEIERFHSALASLGEIVAFTVLGLLVDLGGLLDSDAWWIGLLVAVLLALVVRPLLVGAVLLPIQLDRGERVFVLWAGLKGAVPILLGTFVLSSGEVGSRRAFDVIFVVVTFSVLVQGGLVPALAARLRIPVELVEPQPWALGMRFRDEPHGLHRYRVSAGSPAESSTIADLPIGEGAWVSSVGRDGRMVQVRGRTALRAGDEVLVLAEPEEVEALDAVFGTQASST